MQVAVVGASGYTGAELLRLLVGHPDVSVCGAYAKTRAGSRLASVFAQFTGRRDLPEMLEAIDVDKIGDAAEVAPSAVVDVLAGVPLRTCPSLEQPRATTTTATMMIQTFFKTNRLERPAPRGGIAQSWVSTP